VPRRPDPDEGLTSIAAIVARNVETADLEPIRVPLRRRSETPVDAPGAGGRHRQGLGRFQTLARGGALNLLGVVVSGAMQLVLTVVVARGLGVSGTCAFF